MEGTCRQLVDDKAEEKAIHASKTAAFSWQRKIMKGSEQNNTIMIPVMLQEYSPGNGVKETGVAVTGGQGTGQKAIANVQLMDNEGQSQWSVRRPA